MLEGFFDLHTHTTASDGTLSPEQLIRCCLEAGLSGVGITDHDTMAAIPEAIQLAASSGLTVVPGIEISTEQHGKEIHILGYYCSPNSPSLNQMMSEVRDARKSRMELIVANLRNAGVDITLEQLVFHIGNEAVGRPHIARALVAMGAAESVQDAFDRYLVRGKPGYVPRYKLDPIVAVKQILAAGGVPVLAHPGLIGDDSVIEALIVAGLKGIEVWYPQHTNEQVEHYAEMADSLGLIPTGGSDFHGSGE